MKLHRLQAKIPNSHSLDGLIIQAHMGYFSLRRRNSHMVTMILRRDIDLAASQILHRMIAASMTELEPGSLTAKSQSQKLMPQTDADYRPFPHEGLDGGNLIMEHSGIPGPV